MQFSRALPAAFCLSTCRGFRHALLLRMSDPSTAAANALGASVAPPPPPKQDGTPQPVATGRMCTNGCGKQAGTLECPKCQASVLRHFVLLLLGRGRGKEGSPAQSSANMVAVRSATRLHPGRGRGMPYRPWSWIYPHPNPEECAGTNEGGDQLPSSRSTFGRRMSMTP